MLEFVFGWVGRFFIETLANNMWWWRCCLTISLKDFWPRNSTIFCNSPAVVLGESLATQTLLLTVHQDIDTRSLPGSFVTFSVDRKFLIITLVVEIVIVNALAFCETQLSFAAEIYSLEYQKYILWFFSLWWMIKGFGLCFLYLYFCETGSHGWIISCSESPCSAQNCEYEWKWKYTSEIFYS